MSIELSWALLKNKFRKVKDLIRNNTKIRKHHYSSFCNINLTIARLQ